MIGILDSSLDHGMMSTGRYGSFGAHTFPKVVEGTFVSADGEEYTLGTTRTYDNLKPTQATTLMPEESWHIVNYKDAAENISFDWHSVDQSQFDPQTRPIRPFRRIISSEEWAARRIEITDLYRHRGWTLPRVMQEMSRRGFHGSKKQYKNRITEWGLDKNVKRAEAEAILSEHRRRTALGEPCIFVARGWLVDVANLERFSKRAGLKSRRRSKGSSGDLDSLVDDEEDEVPASVSRQILEKPPKSRRGVSKLPQDVRCIVLPPSYRPVSAPSDLETLRALFHHTSVLFHSFFDRDVYALSHPSSSSSSPSTNTSGAQRQRQLHLTTIPNKTHSPYNDLLQNHAYTRHRKRATDYRTLDTSYDLTLLALSYLRQGKFALAGQTLDQAFAGLDEVVTSDHPNGIGVVIKTVGACYKAGFGEVGEMVVRYVRELGRVRFDDGQSGAGQGDGGWWEGGGRDPRGRLYALLPKVFEASASNGTFPAQGRDAASTAVATTSSPSSSSSAQKSTGSRTTRSGRKRQSTLPLSCTATLNRTDDGGDCDRSGGGGGGGGSARTEAQSHLVSVYELFCQDLWRKKRPENSLLVLLWYPSLFCW